MKKLISILFVLLFLIAMSVAFANAESEASGPPPGWWKKSSLHPQAQYEKWLKTINLSASYNKLSGNTEGDALTLAGSATLRKKRFTATLLHEHKKQDIRQHDDRVKNLKRTTALFGQYDVTSYLFAGTGYVWEKDTNNNIDSRQIFFSGPGFYLLSSDRINLSIYAGLGQTKEKYDDIVKRYTAINERTYDILYFHQTSEWQATKWLILSQGFRLIQSFSDMNEYKIDDETSSVSVTGKSKRSLVQAELSIILPITSYLQYTTRYRYNYDSHPWPGNDSTDTVLTVGLNIKY